MPIEAGTTPEAFKQAASLPLTDQQAASLVDAGSGLTISPNPQEIPSIRRIRFSSGVEISLADTNFLKYNSIPPLGVTRVMATKKAVGRIIHFANLPLKLLMPSTRENITEVAFKTVPSASKIEIKRVLESLYGLQVAKVNTLNMEGKKKRAKGSLAFYRRPDYKKAYVTLKEPVTLPADIFPMNMMEEKVVDGKDANKKQGSKR